MLLFFSLYLFLFKELEKKNSLCRFQDNTLLNKTDPVTMIWQLWEEPPPLLSMRISNLANHEEAFLSSDILTHCWFMEIHFFFSFVVWMNVWLTTQHMQRKGCYFHIQSREDFREHEKVGLLGFLVSFWTDLDTECYVLGFIKHEVLPVTWAN